MSVRHFILATAGHVDHGKSTIVRALTGTDPDRLPEEKSRGMTIDLGFASFAPDPSLSIGIVDVPGHEDFVGNMVAGVGAIDAALMVVAADDGWMPQSEEHLRILRFLDIHHGIIALTKIDRVEPSRIVEVIATLRQQVAETFLADAPIVPVAIPVQRGVDELKAAIVRMFDHVSVPANIGKPRMQIDRSFVLRGAGRIVTGTLTGGNLTRGQSVRVSPAQQGVKIRAVQSHNRDVPTATPGMRVALNLPELDHETAWRGQTITLESLASSSEVLDVRLLRDSHSKSLRRGITLHVHHGTRSVAARLYLFPASDLAQLRLESPLVTFIGDRLVLRDGGGRSTLAGATVLDPSARRSGMRSVERQRYLNRMDGSIDDAIIATIEFRGVVNENELLRQSNFSDDAIHAAVKSNPLLHVAAGQVMTRARWNALLDQLAQSIRNHHRDHPEQSGLTITALRPLAGSLLDPAIQALTAHGFVRMQTVIRSSEHAPALPPRLQPAGARLRTVLAQHPLDPPTRSELAPDPLSQQALAFLKINGEVTELSPAVFISTKAFDHARGQVIDLLRQRTRATVTEIKSAIGTSRRVVVPFLEILDRTGVTRRVTDQSGDWRELT